VCQVPKKLPKAWGLIMFIPISQVNEILSAMHWMITPYESYDSWSDYPYIRTLAMAYNKLLESLDSQGFEHDYSYFQIKDAP
jgi:hypothetical protein